MKLLILLAFSFLCGPNTFSRMPCAKQVFGVLDSPEYSGATTGVYRPVIHEGKDEHHNLPGDATSVDLLHGFIPAAVSAPPTGPIQVTLDKDPGETLGACSCPCACTLVFVLYSLDHQFFSVQSWLVLCHLVVWSCCSS